MSEHGNITGGPWKATRQKHSHHSGEGNKYWQIVGKATDGADAVCDVSDSWVPEASQEANAHLIANAGTAANKLTALGYRGPECVSKLVELVEALARECSGCEFSICETCPTGKLLSQLKED